MGRESKYFQMKYFLISFKSIKNLAKSIKSDIHKVELEYIHHYISATMIADQLKCFPNVKSLIVSKKNE